MKAIIEYGIYGEYDNDNPYIDMLMPNITTVVDKAKDRYNKAIANGKKGGRPKKYSDEEMISLYNQGLTYQQIADQLGCSKSTVEKTISKHKKDNIFLPENRKNPEKPSKNLDVDVDVDDDIDDDVDVDADDDIDVNVDANVDNNEDVFSNRRKNTYNTEMSYRGFMRAYNSWEYDRLNQEEFLIKETGEIVVIKDAPAMVKPTYGWED